MGGHSTVLLLAWLAIQAITIFGDNDTLPARTQETDQKNMGEELEKIVDGDKLRQLFARFRAETDLKDQALEIKNKGMTNPRSTDDGQGPSTDCSQADRSGVYTITAGNSNFDAYCQVDDSEKWTVIQRRTNGRVSFARNWAAYREGFGDMTGDFWLGNEYIHKLTAAGLTRLRVDLEDWDNTKHTVEYSTFMVAGEGDKYRMTVSGFTGSKPPGDSMDQITGMQFSTKDQDNDMHSGFNCASLFGGGGGWWYNTCSRSNLNGIYNGPAVTGILWGTWRGVYSLKAATMMLSKP